MRFVYPELLKKLIHQLSKLPGIGQRSAERLAFRILGWPEHHVKDFVETVMRSRTDLVECSQCFLLTDENLCIVCRSPKRDPHMICVVSTFQELAAIDQVGSYQGHYHVLGGLLSPLDGIGPQDIHLSELIKRVATGPEDLEVIIALTPNESGEATTSYIKSALMECRPGPSLKISRLARGIPLGVDLEYTDEFTLAGALERREDMR